MVPKLNSICRRNGRQLVHPTNGETVFPILLILYFVDFVSKTLALEMTRASNFISHTDIAPKERTAWKPNKYREVSVHKTERFPRAASDTNRAPNKF